MTTTVEASPTTAAEHQRDRSRFRGALVTLAAIALVIAVFLTIQLRNGNDASAKGLRQDDGGTVHEGGEHRDEIERPTPARPKHDSDPKQAIAWSDLPRDLRETFDVADARTVVDGDKRYPATIVHRVTGQPFVYVRSGRCSLGASPDDPEARSYERPARNVNLTGFYIGKTEVSVAVWQRGGGSTKGSANSSVPITNITFDQARAWCESQALELPTEAQWEYAASGEDDRRYPWGDKWQRQCNIKGHEEADEWSDLAPVTALTQGASWCGALNMAGNASEWCLGNLTDGYGSIEPGATNPTTFGMGSWLVARGGSWADLKDKCRTSNRRKCGWKAANGFIGFRCVVALPPAEKR